MNTIRYAVVGLRHGREHVRIIPKDEKRTVSALCDRDADVLERAAGESAAQPKTFTSFDQLLDWGKFDAVVLATPPHVHAELAAKAIRAGKHVFIEKPLTNTLDEARTLIKAAHDAKTVIQVGYCVRSSQLVRRTMELIRSDRIGRVVFMWWHMFLVYDYGHEGWRQERKYGGGKLIDCLCHYMDILGLFAGAPFHRVTAYGTEPGKIGPNPDRIAAVATVIFEYENGVKSNVSLSEVTPSPESSLFGLVGTNGMINGNPWRPEGAGSLDCYLDGGLYREQIAINGAMASRGHLGFTEQHDAFERAITEGAPVPCSLDDGYETQIMMAAVDRSVATGDTIFRKDLLRE